MHTRATFAESESSADATPRAGMLRTIASWVERSRQRRELATLDDHLLADIGLTRAQALRESDKPFWK